MIDGKRYDVNDLDRLPDSLHPFEVATKSNEETLGFFGELCPFSNFYPIDFTFNGQHITAVNNLFNIKRHFIAMIMKLQTKSCSPKARLPANNCPTLFTTMTIKGGLMQPMNDVMKGSEPNSTKIHPCCASFSPQATNYW